VIGRGRRVVDWPGHLNRAVSVRRAREPDTKRTTFCPSDSASAGWIETLLETLGLGMGMGYAYLPSSSSRSSSRLDQQRWLVDESTGASGQSES
jgi:hypothetical protein